MGVYFLLALSFFCFAASILLLLLPQSFPLHLILPFKFVKQQETDKLSAQWNILYHLGGNGPWIPKIDGVVDGGIAIPNGCKIDMIHMMSRHGERYPTQNAGARMIALVERIKSTGRKMKGALTFMNNWDYFSHAPHQHFEQLTTTGPYAGTLEAFGTGVKFRTRYHHLWNDTTPHPPPTIFWASEADRVVDTAKYFGAGFFGLDYEQSGRAKLEIISEAADKGGNTLTPGDTCTKYLEDQETGRSLGEQMLFKYSSTYLPVIAKRLEEENPGFEFTDSEVFSMQEMCGFETTVRGSSKWCNVFSQDEWLKFEYARDVIHFYRAGPGNPYAMAMGWLWLNATANLIQKGPEAGPVFLSFGHDGDIIPMLAALGLFDDKKKLPIDEVYTNRRWRTSQIVPMGGRILLERMVCSADPSHDDSQAGVFIRFNVNDGIVALPGCDSGPGESCPLDKLMAHVAERGSMGGDFRKTCGLPEWAPDRLTFLRQPGRVHVA
ncbi:phosphoglycerate mutase-like protein [Terfezia boudieri ATCC MYA-4762]|uniref:3-phytase n=1 Tax=Terfezia boudieri ATCC MYA-4762 TaxID=1051890 RepID=A0A3N4M2I2_9PEZI|nr:phosphoglycerate mutase-like protein [Terfezia boudieri ATCC MYA-4762]